MTELIKEMRGSALWLTIDRPERRNAMNEVVINGLADAIRQADNNKEVRLVVITGAGDKAFCSGADLATGTSFEFDYGTPSLAFANLLRTANSATVPLLARVNGA